MLGDYPKLFELSVLELSVLKDHISRYDQNGLTIKSFCLTTWSAITAFGVINENAFVILISIGVVLGFSFMEFTYRRFQCRFIQRAAQVEALLASGDLTKYEYSVDRAARSVDLVRETKYSLAQPHFIIFYIMLIVFTLAAFSYIRLI